MRFGTLQKGENMNWKNTLVQLLEKAERTKVLVRTQDIPMVLPTYDENIERPNSESPEYFWCPISALSNPEFDFQVPPEIMRRLEKGFLFVSF